MADGDRYRYRLYLNGVLTSEEWARDAGDAARLGIEYARTCAANLDAWQIEIYNPAAPPDQQYIRFAGIVGACSMPLNLN